MFRLVSKTGTSDHLLRHVGPVRPHGTTQLPLDEDSLRLIFMVFRKSMAEIQVSLISDKNNRVLYTNTY